VFYRATRIAVAIALKRCKVLGTLIAASTIFYCGGLRGVAIAFLLIAASLKTLQSL
jgi:hypothetical protein